MSRKPLTLPPVRTLTSPAFSTMNSRSASPGAAATADGPGELSDAVQRERDPSLGEPVDRSVYEVAYRWPAPSCPKPDRSSTWAPVFTALPEASTVEAYMPL